MKTIINRSPFVLCLLLIILSFSSLAQERRVWNLPTYDKQPLHFGFVLGTNLHYFSLRHSSMILISTPNQTEEREWIYGVETSRMPGLHLGGISNFRLNGYFDFRALFVLSFGQRNLDFSVRKEKLDGSSEWSIRTMQIESIFAQFPLLLKFKSQRINNYRPYLISGINPHLDLASGNKHEEQLVRLRRFDVFLEAGAGIDFYLPFFKFSTEFKYAFGINNMLYDEEYAYTESIGELYSHMFVLSLNFE